MAKGYITTCDSICDYNTAFAEETLNPLVTVVDFSKMAGKSVPGKKTYGFYLVMLKDAQGCSRMLTVAQCAQELHLSANYFGDLVKKETGKSALEFIQSHVISLAKERIFDTSKSISEIAYGLGFNYPQHFTRFFKTHVGMTPNQYRSQS